MIIRFMPVLLGLLIPGSIGYALGYYRRPKDPMIVALREHARLLHEAGKASKRGQSGLAEIYEGSARGVLAMVEDRSPPS